MRENRLNGTIPEDIGSLTRLNSLFLGGNFFTGIMPNHSAVDTDAPPGINLTDLQPEDIFENEDPSAPFLGPETIGLTVAVVIVSSFLTAFLMFSFYVAQKDTAENRRTNALSLEAAKSPSI